MKLSIIVVFSLIISISLADPNREVGMPLNAMNGNIYEILTNTLGTLQLLWLGEIGTTKKSSHFG